MRSFLCPFVSVLMLVLVGCDGDTGVSLDLCVLASTCSFDNEERVGVGDTCNLLTMLDATAASGRGTEAKLARVTLSCLKKATNCDDMFSCLKASESEAAVCESADGEDRCSSDVMVECDDYPYTVPDAFDCAAAGLVCGELDGSAQCGSAPCDPDTDAPYCDGDLLVTCDEAGVLVSQDCSFFLGLSCTLQSCHIRAGGACGTNPQGNLDCVGTGDGCDPDTFEPRCDGSVIVSCNRGKQSRLDCKKLHPDLTCGFDAARDTVTCVPARNECSINGDDTCQQGVITTCLMGEITEVDCTRYGHTGCATTREGTRTIAYCVP